MKGIYLFLGKLLFPSRCPYCGRVVGFAEGCSRCREALPLLALWDCEALTREAGSRTIERLVACYCYAGAAKRAVWRLKFRGLRTLALPLGLDMARQVATELAEVQLDCIIPVPSSKKSLAKRGYNVPGLLAKTVGRALAIPVRDDILLKEYETRYQHELSRAGRAANLLGAFAVRDADAVRGKTVLLLDDIVTTGATLGECAKMLELAGAKKIYAVCFAAAATQPEPAQRCSEGQRETADCTAAAN